MEKQDIELIKKARDHASKINKGRFSKDACDMVDFARHLTYRMEAIDVDHIKEITNIRIELEQEKLKQSRAHQEKEGVEIQYGMSLYCNQLLFKQLEEKDKQIKKLEVEIALMERLRCLQE